MQAEGSSFRVMILGQNGAGKSTLGNILLNLDVHSGERFTQQNDVNDRKAFSSQYLHKTVNGFHLHVIDTPGFFKPPVTMATANWGDIVHAFEISEQKVDSFLLVLNSKNPEIGEKVVEAFVSFFGPEGATRSVVVFTHNDVPFRRNSTRIVKNNHFEYLRKYLKDGFPFYFWKTDVDHITQRDELIQEIKETAECNQYVHDSFTKAQFKFAKEYIRSLQGRGENTQAGEIEELANLGIPHYLLVRFFNEQQHAELLQVANCESMRPSNFGQSHFELSVRELLFKK